MIRVILFLIVVGLLALGEAWLADRPGDVVVTWLGFRIETSLMVAIAAALAALVVLLIVWSVVRAIVRSPAVLAKRRRERRGERAYAAISNVQYRLSEVDGGTLIKFRHAALGLIQDDHRKNVSRGWGSLQERIRARAEGDRS